MKKPVLLIALIPVQLVGLFFCAEQLTHSQKDAWNLVGIVGGISIVTWLMVMLAQRLNKPN